MNLFPEIFPIEWGAGWSYFEFPNKWFDSKIIGDDLGPNFGALNGRNPWVCGKKVGKQSKKRSSGSFRILRQHG